MSQPNFYLRGQAKLKNGIWQPGRTIIHVPAEVAAEIDKRNNHSSRLNAVGCTIDDQIKYAAIIFDGYVHNPHPTVKEQMQPLGSVLFDLNGRAISHTQSLIDFLQPEGKKLEIFGNHNSIEFWSPQMFKLYERGYAQLGEKVRRALIEAADEVAFGASYAG